ncbi:SDR family oxidoreductase [Bradyrhizobium liaoningense]|uniref:SDR family oxidoreductase n=1 Tax=Bradyrhizobium liaoningense TaxID=43992 RepID=UPI001BAE1D5E|nr:SDR family oxidoreductase [Bradyrhizobium liaoningense]MBR0816627.1 SDR family oxidoreductase [Bradyrhizobium liaoningense]
MSSPQRKVAIITGSARGIGAAIAERLSRDRFSVVINYAASATEADVLADKIEMAGGRAIVAQADVSQPSDVERMFEMADVAFGGVDVLVNNAGIMQLSPIAEATDAQFDAQIAVNLKGAFNTLREAARRIRQGGRIISLSSSQVDLLHPSYAIYAATKAGVETMTRVLAKELRGRKITVNAIAPGPIATALFPEGNSREAIDHRPSLAPLDRPGQPVDIAAIVAFLAGQDGAWINGEVIRANGGII